MTPKQEVPFSRHCTASLPALNNRHRLRQIRGFVGLSGGLTFPSWLKVLDVGSRNYIGFGLRVTDFTEGDLNVEMRTRLTQYDVVTCFEVLNHVMNMGILLDNIRAKLKVGGKLYLSTPRLGLFAWMHGQENFTELKKRSLVRLLEYKGFRVLRYEVKRSYPFRFCFYGFRPPFKWLLHKYQIVEAVKC